MSYFCHCQSRARSRRLYITFAKLFWEEKRYWLIDMIIDKLLVDLDLIV